MMQRTLDSFRAAGWGLLTTLATQPHMRVHVVSAVMVMIVAMMLPLDLGSRTALLFAVALVFFAEVINTALEHFVDLHIQEFHVAAMRAKDAAAAGVLVLSVATVAVLGDILWHQWSVVVASAAAVRRGVLYGIPLTVAVIALLWGPDRVALKALLGVAALALAVPLWLSSNDPVSSAVLGLLILLAAIARPRPVPDADQRARAPRSRT